MEKHKNSAPWNLSAAEWLIMSRQKLEAFIEAHPELETPLTDISDDICNGLTVLGCTKEQLSESSEAKA
jgi:hypothetical protein